MKKSLYRASLFLLIFSASCGAVKSAVVVPAQVRPVVNPSVDIKPNGSLTVPASVLSLKASNSSTRFFPQDDPVTAKIGYPHIFGDFLTYPLGPNSTNRLCSIQDNVNLKGSIESSDFTSDGNKVFWWKNKNVEGPTQIGYASISS